MIDVSIKVNGYQITQLVDVEVSLQLYNLANMARLSFHDKDSQDLKNVKTIIEENAEAVVYFDKQPVLSGYVYKPSPEFSDNGAGFTVIVTSPVAKYIGQAVIVGKTCYNQRVSDILADLCPDIKIETRADKVLPRFVTYGFETIGASFKKYASKPTQSFIPAHMGSLL